MYEEEEKRGFPLRDLIVKLIVAVVFVLLLVWLLPKVDLTGLNNRIFKDNVINNNGFNRNRKFS